MIDVLHGDCIVEMMKLDAESADACVTDPPYHLTNNGGSRLPNSGQYTPIGRPQEPRGGFMGKLWDGGDIAFRPETWASVLRVLKPGAHLLAFGAPKNAHRLTVAIEDAGFEIRDVLMWVFGSGFPKSHNLDGKHEGWGTALKPAYEPIVLARKPTAGTVATNALEHGTGALNIDGCRVETADNLNGGAYATHGARAAMAGDEREGVALGMYQPGKTAETEYVPPAGRWPANLIHDGSDEVLAAFPQAPGQQRAVGPQHGTRDTVNVFGNFGPRTQTEPRSDTGSAARFFYCAKASAADRLGSNHPTVKPIALMRYLCRLVTPSGGLILDPFAGTGTTGQAARDEGFDALLIEREDEYVADILRRLANKPSDELTLADL